MSSGDDSAGQREAGGESAPDFAAPPASRPRGPGDVRPVRRYPPLAEITVLDQTDEPGHGLKLAPPPPGIAVPVDAHAAYRIAQDHGHCRTDRGPVITLALATTDTPARVDSAGHATRIIEDRLVQVLRWDDINWAPSGPPVPPRHPPRGPAHGTQWIFVDAWTGDVILDRLVGVIR